MGQTNKEGGKHQDVITYERSKISRVQENKTKLKEIRIKNIFDSSISLVESQKKNKGRGKMNVINAKDQECIPNVDIACKDDEEYDTTGFSKEVQVGKKNCYPKGKEIPPMTTNRYASILRRHRQGVSDNDQINVLQGNQFRVQSKEQIDRVFMEQIDRIFMADAILKNKSISQEKLASPEKHKGKTVGPNQSALHKKTTNFGEHECTEYDSGTSSEDDHDADFNRDEDMLHETDEDEENNKVDGSEAESLDYDDDINDDEEEDTDEFDGEHESGRLHLENEQPGKKGSFNKKRRGPTLMHKVHTRPLKQRKTIILNEFYQPIGPQTPAEDTVGEFSRFLGTIARDYSYAPLTYKSWRKVPNKDKMWDYVLTKYIVPEEAKCWVLSTISQAYRVHKCRFKQAHYYMYHDDKSRWKNRPKMIPDEDFRKLLDQWNNKEEKLLCVRNQDIRKARKNNHTAGPKGFARIREKLKMEDPNNDPPSLAQMFEHTRKRKEGNIYVDSYDDTSEKIEEMKSYEHSEDGICKDGQKDSFIATMPRENNGSSHRLYGRGVTNKLLKKVKGTGTSYIVHGELMQSIQSNGVEDVQNGLKVQMENIAEMWKELDAEKAELEKMKKDLEIQKNNMANDVLKKLVSSLSGFIPPELSAQIIGETIP